MTKAMFDQWVKSELRRVREAYAQQPDRRYTLERLLTKAEAQLRQWEGYATNAAPAD